jgi:hypothetical protein
MPLGFFEREVLQVISSNRNPESYVAGATVLNQSADSPRESQDIDVFHDTQSAVRESYLRDEASLLQSGFNVKCSKQDSTFCRARVSKGSDFTKVEWVYDSAFRFYPIEPDVELGYRLNFWDAATNKVLAGASRDAIRDYIDLVELHEKYLSLGALVWAAAGKDDGLSPPFILNEMSRLQRYPKQDYELIRESRPIDPKVLKVVWLKAMEEAKHLFDVVLLNAPYGCLFLDETGKPVSPTAETLPKLRPHFGSVRGAWPRIAEE